MGEQTGISWCHHTLNFFIGCRKVSPACANCYAGTFVKNRMGKPFYPETGTGRVATDADSPVWRTKTWRDPIRWDRAARAAGEVRRVFTCSLSDFFLDHPQVHEWRREAWQIMRDTPNLLWLVLSKRWDEGADYIRSCLPDDWDGGYPNVMLGATVESQGQASRLREACMVPCDRGLFVSAEPLLGPLALTNIRRDNTRRLDALRGIFYHAGEPSQSLSRVRWVIGGGESGSNARPTHPDWARRLRDDAAAAGVPYHWKQWGCWVPAYGAGYDSSADRQSRVWRVWWDGRWCSPDDLTPDEMKRASELPGSDWMARVGVDRAGRMLDGVHHDGVPEATR